MRSLRMSNIGLIRDSFSYFDKTCFKTFLYGLYHPRMINTASHSPVRRQKKTLALDVPHFRDYCAFTTQNDVALAHMVTER
jgi:hypothetical protein